MNNKVHISRVLIEIFSSKKEIDTKLQLLTPLKCYSHLVNPAGFNPNRSALWLRFRNIQTRFDSRMCCLLRHPRIQCIVSTIMTEWARCYLHSEPTSTTTRHIKRFHNPNKYFTLHKHPAFVQSTSGSHANSNTRKA